MSALIPRPSDGHLAKVLTFLVTAALSPYEIDTAKDRLPVNAPLEPLLDLLAQDACELGDILRNKIHSFVHICRQATQAAAYEPAPLQLQTPAHSVSYAYPNLQLLSPESPACADWCPASTFISDLSAIRRSSPVDVYPTPQSPPWSPQQRPVDPSAMEPMAIPFPIAVNQVAAECTIPGCACMESDAASSLAAEDEALQRPGAPVMPSTSRFGGGFAIQPQPAFAVQAPANSVNYATGPAIVGLGLGPYEEAYTPSSSLPEVTVPMHVEEPSWTSFSALPQPPMPTFVAADGQDESSSDPFAAIEAWRHSLGVGDDGSRKRSVVAEGSRLPKKAKWTRL